MSAHNHQHDINSERIGVVFFLNFFFTIIEFVGGILTNSTAIMADAVHDFGNTHDSIVFLYGIGGTSRYWKTRVQPLASSYRLILIDPLGYRQSPKPWTKYTVDCHVEKLYEVLCDQESLTIVGHSFGSIVALTFAVRYPHIVRRLILISLPYFGNREGAMCYFCNSYLANRYVMSNIVFAAVACISATKVHGYGEAPNIFNFDSISAYARVEILIESTKVEEAAQSIIDAAHTSKEGYGMAAILPVE